MNSASGFWGLTRVGPCPEELRNQTGHPGMDSDIGHDGDGGEVSERFPEEMIFELRSEGCVRIN